jgi:glycolate oxidase FAD binding subunit
VSDDFDALRLRLEDLCGRANVGADLHTNSAFVVDGVCPSLTVRPRTQDEVAGVVSACAAAGAALIPWGGGTAMSAGNPPERADVVVCLDRLDRVVEFDAPNLCVTVEAGATLASLCGILAEKAERLPLDPAGGDRTTVGGLVAADQSGPSRLLHGTPRDWVLGMRVVLPNGERVRCGGRVIKNVSGYDMNKLFIRSFGTLGVITEVTFRLLPSASVRATVVGLFRDQTAAASVVEGIKGSFLLPQALELLDPAALVLAAPAMGIDNGHDFGLVAGFAGSAATVDRQVRDSKAMVTAHGGSPRFLGDEASTTAWEALADPFRRLPAVPLRVICKVAVPIGATGELMESVRHIASANGVFSAAAAHVASGVVRMALLASDNDLSSVVETVNQLRQHAEHAGGSLVLWEAPPRIKAVVEAWGRTGSGIAVMRRVKARFDPKRICSPGRFVGGI